jgi:hypothetical protein
MRSKKMRSSGNVRRNLLTAGGILSIVGGISQIICSGLMIVDFVVSYLHNWRLIYALFLPGLPDAWQHYVLWGPGPMIFSANYVPIRWAIIGGCLGVLGIVAVVGGISAVRRKRFGLSLAGAICALPSVFLGIMAVIFVSWERENLVRREKEMASNDNSKGKLLTAGGILSIMAGILEINAGVLIFLTGGIEPYTLWLLPFLPGVYVDWWRSLVWSYFDKYFPIWLIIAGGLLFLGILAVVGGISAIRRKRFGVSLAGAICALISGLLGILAVIFVALGKREFGAKA